MTHIIAQDSHPSLHTINIVIASLLIVFFLPNVLHADQKFRLRAHVEHINSLNADDIRAEIYFGRNVAARILGRLPLYQDEKLNRYVNLVGKAVALHSARTEIDYYFAILDSHHINAYSAPGGYIFITRGALKYIKNEAELAAVLAHEIAHITERHIVNELNIRADDTSATAGLGRILGGSSNTTKAVVSQVVDKAVSILFEQGYHQQDELDADRISIELLAATGYDPTALSGFLLRLQDTLDKAPSETASTHPPTEVRQKNLDTLLTTQKMDALNFPKATDRFKKYVTLTQ